MNRGDRTATGFGERRIGAGLAFGIVLWIVTLVIGAWLIRTPVKAPDARTAAQGGAALPAIVVAGSQPRP